MISHNGLHLALARWIRKSRALHLLQFRKNWALMRGEYECVGGPLDGQVIKWEPQTDYYLVNGLYRHEADFRLHYHVCSPCSHWQGDLE